MDIWNATLVNIQVLSIVLYYIIIYYYIIVYIILLYYYYIRFILKTQPWHSKCHYTYYLVFHQTFKHNHQYETNIKYLYYIQY